MAKDYAKVYRGENVMKRGIATYKDEAVFLSQDTLRRDMETLKGRPVVIKHQNVTPENMEEKAVGYVTETFYNNEAGTFGCKFVVFDDEAKELIKNGYGLSTCYKPTSFGAGGTEINTPYDREVTGLNFTHLALVPDPRYEDVKIYENGVMEMEEETLLNGGEGSGDFDHAGRPGEVGGSEPAGTGREGKYTKSGGQNWVGAKPKQGKLFDEEEEDDDKINKLIEMADSVSMFDSGSIEKREHKKNIQLIKELNISDDEKKEAIKKINNYHKMILEHLAKSPTSAKIGPAKFKDLHSKSLSHYEKALDLKSERNAILKNLEEKLKKEKTKQENKKLFEVSKEALEKGLLEFEHNGEIWFRKTKRRQGFTQLDDWSKKDYEEMKSKQKQNAIIEEQERENAMENAMENEKMEIPVSFFDKVMDLICNSKKEKKNEEKEIEEVIEEEDDEMENKCKKNEVVDKRDIIRQIMAIAGKKEASEDVKTIAKLAEKLAYDKDEAEKENAKEDLEYNNDEFFNAMEIAKAKGESDRLPAPETQAKQIERGKKIFG